MSIGEWSLKIITAVISFLSRGIKLKKKCLPRFKSLTGSLTRISSARLQAQ